MNGGKNFFDLSKDRKNIHFLRNNILASMSPQQTNFIGKNCMGLKFLWFQIYKTKEFNQKKFTLYAAYINTLSRLVNKLNKSFGHRLAGQFRFIKQVLNLNL